MLCTFRRRLALFLPSSSRTYMRGSLQHFPHKNKVYFKCQRIKQGPLQGQAVFQSQDAGDHHNRWQYEYHHHIHHTLSQTGDHDRLCQAYTQHPAFWCKGKVSVTNEGKILTLPNIFNPLPHPPHHPTPMVNLWIQRQQKCMKIESATYRIFSIFGPYVAFLIHTWPFWSIYKGSFQKLLSGFFPLSGYPPPPPYPFNRKSFCQKTLSGRGGYNPPPP